jgi:predicted nucleotidyltransferase
MMKSSDEQLLASFKRRLECARVPVVKVLAFGSRARGDAYPDSDVDALVIVEHRDSALRRTISDAAWEVGYELGVVLAPVVLTREEFERSPFSESMFVRNVLKEGIAI